MTPRWRRVLISGVTGMAGESIPATIRTELARPGRRTDSDEAFYRWPFLRLAFLFLCLRPPFPFELAPV